MKQYLIITEMTIGALTAIIEADTVLPMRGEPDFIVPINPRVFWARSQNDKEDATEKLDVLGSLGYQKNLTFDTKGLIKIIFER